MAKKKEHFNQVVKIANERKNTLLTKLQQDQASQLFNPQTERAWQNESDLSASASSLEVELMRGIDKLEVALSAIRENKTLLLNSCGILQGTHQAIERGVTEVKEKMKNRLYYSELFKS